MPTGRQVAGFLHKARRYLFGYDAVEWKNRRQSPTSALPQGVLPTAFVHGVRVDEAGQALGYAVCKRPVSGADFAFERLIPAPYVVQHAFFDGCA
jgi:hypothetical protein